MIFFFYLHINKAKDSSYKFQQIDKVQVETAHKQYLHCLQIYIFFLYY